MLFRSSPITQTLPTRYFHRESKAPPDWLWECDDDDGDFRFYEFRYGAKVYLTFFAKTFYTNGKIASEGAFLDGYKSGIWRFYNENGVLCQVGRYNKENERWGKWKYYEELNGRACRYMTIDIRGNREKYWCYDMDGKLWHQHTIYNALGEIEDFVHVTDLYEPTYRRWPQSY